MGQPRDVLVGICSQVVLLPIVGFALAGTWPMAPELALGVMLGVLTHQFAKPAARRLHGSTPSPWCCLSWCWWGGG